MTNTVLLKRSGVANSVPAAGNIALGELAINYADGNLFFKDSNSQVQLLTSSKFVSVTGNITGGNVSVTGNITSLGNISGNYILGDGSFLSNLAGGTTITNGNSNIAIVTANGNATVAIAGLNNSALFSKGSFFTAGPISTPKFVDHQSLVASNVNAQLFGSLSIGPTGNIFVPDSSTLEIGVRDALSGNLVGNIVGNAYGLDSIAFVSVIGNVTANYFIGNGSQLTGISSTPGGTNTTVQFNDAGVLSGTAGLTFDKISNALLSTGRVQGDIIQSQTGVFVGGPTQNTSLSVSNSFSSFSFGSYVLAPGSTGTLGSAATQTVFNKDYSIVGGAGIQVQNGVNTVTISANVSNIVVSNTSANTVLYPLLTASTSGNLTAVQTGGTFLQYTPATGNLTVGNLVSYYPLATTSGGTGQNRFIAGQDYVAPTVPTTISATQVFAGAGANISLKILNSADLLQLMPVALTGTLNFYIAGGASRYATANATANWQMSFGWNGGDTLNSVMQQGDSVRAVLLATQGSSAFYPTAFSIDGASVVPRWQGGTAPTAGNANSIDRYEFQIIKTGNATWAVLASQTRFA